MNVNQWGAVNQWGGSVEPPVDTVPPVIVLIGSPSVSVTEGTTYVDAGATASDDVDGDITDSIVVTNTVNIAIPSTYTVSYNVTDSAGNAATEVVRSVEVVAADVPVFLKGTIPNRVSRIGGVFELDTSLYFDGTQTPFTYALTGTLPDGLVFNTSTGIISGTSTTDETQNVSVTATDSDGATASSNSFSIRSQDAVVIDLANRGSYTSMYSFLLTQGYEGEIIDVLNTWLEDEGYLGAFNDKWYKYLEAEGLSGALPDKNSKWRNE